MGNPKKPDMRFHCSCNFLWFVIFNITYLQNILDRWPSRSKVKVMIKVRLKTKIWSNFAVKEDIKSYLMLHWLAVFKLTSVHKKCNVVLACFTNIVWIGNHGNQARIVTNKIKMNDNLERFWWLISSFYRASMVLNFVIYLFFISRNISIMWPSKSKVKVMMTTKVNDPWATILCPTGVNII